MPEPFSILVVDDNPNNRVTMQALLSRIAGCNVLEAESGEQALRMTVEQTLHLILLDVQMPGMDGFETAELLRMTERTKRIPIIFVTAVSRSEPFIARGYQLGAVDYLTKPIDDNLLLNRILLYKSLTERQMELLERSAALEAANAQLRSTLDTLRQTQEHLIQSEKLAALGPLVAGVAHELNTPLGNSLMVASAMLGRMDQFAELLASGQLNRRSQLEEMITLSREGSSMILRGIERAADLVRNFKQVAVNQASSGRQKFDLLTTVNAIVALLSASLRKTSHRLEIDIQEKIMMDGYPGPIEQIVSNLINNALLHAFKDMDVGLMQLQARPVDDRVTISFRDNGCGMTPDVVQRVFDPFFTTRLGTGGSGLGMHICYNLVTGPLGGSIRVHSQPGQGSEFTLDLPLVAPD